MSQAHMESARNLAAECAGSQQGAGFYFSLSFPGTCSFSLALSLSLTVSFCLHLRHLSLSLPIAPSHTALQVQIRLQLGFPQTPRARDTLPAGRIGSRVSFLLPQILQLFVNHIPLACYLSLPRTHRLEERGRVAALSRVKATFARNVASFPREPDPFAFLPRRVTYIELHSQSKPKPESRQGFESLLMHH